MAKLKVDKRPLKQIPVGDMRDRILIRQRGIGVPTFDNPAKFDEDYKTIASVWAKVKTNVSGKQMFDGVNAASGGGIILSSTHVFTIRYRDDITSENVVDYKGENYEINRVVNPEERNMYLELYCKLLGDRGLEANQ